MLTLEDYFGRMSRAEKPTPQVELNAGELLRRVNALLVECAHIPAAHDPVVNSGWRTRGYNATVDGAAVNSRHITGEAIDIADPDGELDEYLFDNPHILAKHELWMEHPLATKSWAHFQSVPPRSGRRHFYP